MAKPGPDSLRALPLAQPLAPRLQLIAAPALLYLVSIVGSQDWWWIAAVLIAGGVAWLGSAVLRRTTVPWFILTTLMILVLSMGTLDLVGVIDDVPLWQNVVDILLATVVLQALLAAPTRPRGEVWAEIARRWLLVLTGLVVMVLFLTTGGGADAHAREENMTPVEVLIGLALAIWAFVVWRVVRRFRSQKAHLPSVS